MSAAAPPPWAPKHIQPAAPAGHAPQKSGVPTWVIVVIVCGGFLLLFGGIFATLAIYGVRKYIANAKVAEAHASLAAIGMDAAQAYERGATTPKGQSVHRVCPSASASVPASIASVKAAKYQSSAADWDVDRPRNAGFACLGFSLLGPQYFMYSYHSHGSNKPGDGFTADAVADFAGDGELTSLHSSGTVSATHTLDVAPPGAR